MKRLLTLAILASLAPGSAFAQSAAPTFTGPHVAIMGGWNQNQDKKVLTGTGNDSEKKGGVVVRGAIGYDHAIGDLGIIGAELGIATGGRAVTTNSGGSTYRTDPNISFDATARAGVKPIDNLLLFGKAGSVDAASWHSACYSDGHAYVEGYRTRLPVGRWRRTLRSSECLAAGRFRPCLVQRPLCAQPSARRPELPVLIRSRTPFRVAARPCPRRSSRI